MEKDRLTKETTIMDAVEKHPEIVEVLMKHGFHCVGCHAAQYESIEQGAIVHGIDVGELMKDLNNAVEKAKDKKENQEQGKKTGGEIMKKVMIDKETCIGCGVCATATANIEMKEVDNSIKAVLKRDQIEDSEIEEHQKAAEVCPVDAIKIEDE